MVKSRGYVDIEPAHGVELIEIVDSIRRLNYTARIRRMSAEI